MNNKYHDYVPNEIKEWLIVNYKGSKDEVIDKIYKEFGYKITPQKLKNTIHYIRRKHFIPEIRNTRFTTDGEIGKEQRFKKLDINEVKRSTGYFIRVNNKWKRRSRIIYEKECGEIPKDMKILHINGDKYNDRIENLCLVTRKQQSYISGNNWCFDNKEIFNTAITLTELIELKNKKIGDINARKELFI